MRAGNESCLLGFKRPEMPVTLIIPYVQSMNNVRSMAQGTRIPFGPALPLNSDAMLSELLKLHEEMIGQLRVERGGGLVTPDLIRSMIEQHETAATKLRAQLQHYEAKSS